MTGVPEGPHWITVYAGATAFAYETRHETVGIYYTQYYVSYKTAGFSMVNFTIDTVKPRILSLSVLNKTLSASDVRLEMLTNEPIMKTTCSLDGQTNVTIIGNTTLSGLPVGLHNITVYVWDAAGNVGASETISFTVVEPESFPTVPVIAVFAGSAVAVAGAGLVLFTRRKRHREAKQT
jgi:hypothetical protein